MVGWLVSSSSYRDIMALDDIDAVMIASPDHLHCLHLEAAIKAKKDAYVEKPLAMDMVTAQSHLRSREGESPSSANGNTPGSQLRHQRRLQEALSKSGAIGKVSRI